MNTGFRIMADNISSSGNAFLNKNTTWALRGIDWKISSMNSPYPSANISSTRSKTNMRILLIIRAPFWMSPCPQSGVAITICDPLLRRIVSARMSALSVQMWHWMLKLPSAKTIFEVRNAVSKHGVRISAWHCKLEALVF